MNELQKLEAIEKQLSIDGGILQCLSEDRKQCKKTEWHLEDELLNFEGNPWTLQNACEGVICFGATGSGKTSGPLKEMALSFLKEGYGGIVFCVKPDESDNWVKYAETSDRKDDLIFLSEESFNFLRYEQTRPGSGAGEIENIVNLFMEISSVGKDTNIKVSSDEYWKDAVKQFLRNAVTLLLMSEQPLNLINIKKIIDSAPRTSEELRAKKGYCLELIKEININLKKESDYQLLKEYFTGEFANLDNRTRSNIISSFTVIVDSFLRGKLKECFCEDTTFTPEMITDGKILLVDYNIKEWQKLGSYASAVIKFCFMKAIERRHNCNNKDVRPVFLFADECQNFAIPYDHHFQATARSSRVITVYGTQNLGNLQSAYGRAEVSSLLGNLGTKIFCQNGDGKTNFWASNSIGQVIVKRKSVSKGENTSGKNGEISSSESVSEGWNEQKDFLVDPIEFTTLLKGSIQNQCRVEFVFWQSGRIFKNKKSFLRTFCRQECQKSCGAKKEYRCKLKSKLFKIPIPGMSNFIEMKEIFQITVFTGSVLCACYAYYLIVNGEDRIILKSPFDGFYITLAGLFLWSLSFGILEGIGFIRGLILQILTGGEKQNSNARLKKGINPEVFPIYMLFSTYFIYKLYDSIVYDEGIIGSIVMLTVLGFIAETIMGLGQNKINTT